MKGLFQSVGDMDVRGGLPLIIKELPGELKRNGKLPHTINPQAARLGDKIDFGNIGFGIVGQALPGVRECESK